jgi:hypothetical protein
LIWRGGFPGGIGLLHERMGHRLSCPARQASRQAETLGTSRPEAINQVIIVQKIQIESHLILPLSPEGGGEGRGEGKFAEELACANMDSLVVCLSPEYTEFPLSLLRE